MIKLCQKRRSCWFAGMAAITQISAKIERPGADIGAGAELGSSSEEMGR
jgi:hypothetical protein